MRNLRFLGVFWLALVLSACGGGGGGGGGGGKKKAAPAIAPGKPSAVAAFPGDGQVGLAWAPPASGGAPAGYKIYRSTGLDPITTGTLIHQAGASDAAFMDGGLSNFISYYYAVVATNTVGDSPPSDVVTAKPIAGLPGAPGNLTAAGGDEQVNLTWTAPGDGGGPTVYQLYRAVLATDLTVGGIQWEWPIDNPTAYADTAVTNFTTYYYAVRATNPTGDGPISNVVSAMPNNGAPGAPLNAIATPGDREVALTWDVPTGGQPFEYRVYRGDAQDFAPGDALTTLGPQETSYTDSELTNYQTYYYRIQAANPVGTGEYSAEVSGWPNDGVPGQPQSLVSSAGDAAVTLTWQAPPDGGAVQTYRVYRSATAVVAIVDNALAGTVPVGTLGFTDATGVENYTTYYYAVVAANPVGLGSPTPAVADMPGLLPAAPSALAAGTIAAPVALTWSAPGTGGRVDGYAVYRSSTPGVNTNGTATLVTGVNSATDLGTGNYQRYYYRVAATNPKGQGPPSEEIQVFPKDYSVPLASDPPLALAGGDQIGRSVALNGSYALVGAPRVDGSQADVGAVHVYQLQGDFVWRPVTTLRKVGTTADPLAAEQFGYSVAISGNVALVGAPLANWPLTTPPSTTNSGNGRVYVYRRQTASSWLLEKNFGSNTQAVSDQFGFSVAADGNTAIVGAREDQTIGGSDACGTARGAVYFFDISPGSGQNALARFEPVDPQCSSGRRFLQAGFGRAVAISGDFAIVGAPEERISSVSPVGAVYFYRRVNGTWQHLGSDKKKATDASTHLGLTVAIKGTLAAAGSPGQACLAPEPGCSAGITEAGAVHLYQWTGSAWTEFALLRSPLPTAGEHFGQTIALDGNMIVVGSGPLSLDGLPSATPAMRRVYWCSGSGAAWSCRSTPLMQESNNLAVSEILPNPFEPGFGVAIEGQTIVVGRPSADRQGQAGTDDAGDVEFY